MADWSDPWEEWENTPALREDDVDRTIEPPERFMNVLISIALLCLGAVLVGLTLVTISIAWPFVPMWLVILCPVFILILVPITNGIYNKIRQM